MTSTPSRRWSCSTAGAPGLSAAGWPFVKAAATIRKHHDGILAAIRLGISNGLIEGLNNKVRLIIRRAYGFHSAEAALALVSCRVAQWTCSYLTSGRHEQTSVSPQSARRAVFWSASRRTERDEAEHLPPAVGLTTGRRW